jgi:hypothetical protein
VSQGSRDPGSSAARWVSFKNGVQMTRHGQIGAWQLINVAVVRRLCLVWLLAPSLALAQEGVVEVIPARNRPAEELVAAIQPVVGQNGSVTSLGGRLIVRASPAVMAEVKRVLSEIDTPARALWIEIRLARTTQAQSASGGASVAVGAPGPQATETRHGTTVERRTTRTVVSGAFSSGSEQSDQAQRIRALEGSPSFISVGQATPAGAAVQPTPNGRPLSSTPVYQETETGFYAIPHLAGSLVTLELAVKVANASGGSIDFVRLGTTVTGQLGEWLDVASALRTESTKSTGIVSLMAGRLAESSSVALRVQEAR